MGNVEEQLRVLHNLRQAFTTFWADRPARHTHVTRTCAAHT